MKLKSKWKALVQGAILLVMLILAGTVVFASECGDGTLKVDLYGPMHVTKIWLDNNNAGNTRPEEIYLAEGDYFYLYPTDYAVYGKELNEMLERSPKELWEYSEGTKKLTAEENWEATFNGIYFTYLVEIAPPEGYEQILKDGNTLKWKFYTYSTNPDYDESARYGGGYHNVYNYLGYDGVRQMFLVNRLKGSTETVTTYTVTYNDNVEGEEIFPDNVHEDIPKDGVTPAFTGNKIGTSHKSYDGDFAEPVRQGYTFMGWKDKEGNDFSPTVTKDTIYYAQWKEGTSDKPNRTYRVTYNDGVEEEVIFEDEVNRGNLYGADTPAFRGDTGTKETDGNGNTIPVRDGYKFTGWKDEAGNGWSETIVDCVTYYAQWEKASEKPPYVSTYYTVTYTDGVDGEEVFKDEINSWLSYGEKTPQFKNGDADGKPVREGYEFTGWTPAVADTVTGNAVYTATWKKLGEVPPTDPADPENPGTDVDDPDVPAGSFDDEVEADDSNVPLGAADDTETGTPKTGDEAPVALLIVLLALSACGFGALTLNRRKHQ
ncbi:MAG: InlB B-repeat-containing protein [Anaerovoracaceae bacterium]|nr:InlB B-repeat-containing protein [Anaerovoracaceae bacterium]